MGIHNWPEGISGKCEEYVIGEGWGGGRENDWGPRWVKSVDKEWLVPLGAP